MPENKQTHQSKKPESSPQRRIPPAIQTHVSHPASIIQRARINPKSLTAADILQLQRTIGNRAVGRLLSKIRNPSKVQQLPIQRQEIPEEEEPLKGKMIETVQRQEISEEEEEPLQGKFETIQRLEPENEEKLQMKSVVQRQERPQEKSDGEFNFRFVDNRPEAIAQRKLQATTNNSQLVEQVADLQAMVNNTHIEPIQMMLKKSGTEGVFVDDRYPGLVFSLNQGETDKQGENVYDVTGEGLRNPTSVTCEVGRIYYDMGGKTWEPLMEGEERTVGTLLNDKLNAIAEKYKGERCHECAKEMQDAFNIVGGSAVYEIYTTCAEEDGNHIMVMGSRVRNHYVNVFDGRVYDSGTGGAGVLWDNYFKDLQSKNKDRTLQFREARDDEALSNP